MSLPFLESRRRAIHRRGSDEPAGPQVRQALLQNTLSHLSSVAGPTSRRRCRGAATVRCNYAPDGDD